MVGGGAAGDEGGVEGSVEGGEAGLAGDGEGEQINVGEVLRGGQAREAAGVEERVVVGPELVAGHGGEAGEERARGLGGTRATGVGRVAEDAENRVFRDGAGGPAGVRVGFEKGLGGHVVGIGRIEQADEHVDVEQVHQRGRARPSARSNSS